MTYWTPTKQINRLPKAETHVLIFAEGYKRPLYALRADDGWEVFLRDGVAYWRDGGAPRVTHWRDLPDNPTPEDAMARGY